MLKCYSRLKCSIPKGDDRNSLVDKALEFSRQAPKNTCRDQSDESNCDQCKLFDRNYVRRGEKENGNTLDFKEVAARN